jgi:hypothetical protein
MCHLSLAIVIFCTITLSCAAQPSKFELCPQQLFLFLCLAQCMWKPILELHSLLSMSVALITYYILSRKIITPWASGILCHPAVASFMLRIFTEPWEITSKLLSSWESGAHPWYQHGTFLEDAILTCCSPAALLLSLSDQVPPVLSHQV